MGLEGLGLLSWDELLGLLGWFCPLLVRGLGTPELNASRHHRSTHHWIKDEAGWRRRTLLRISRALLSGVTSALKTQVPTRANCKGWTRSQGVQFFLPFLVDDCRNITCDTGIPPTYFLRATEAEFKSQWSLLQRPLHLSESKDRGCIPQGSSIQCSTGGWTRGGLWNKSFCPSWTSSVPCLNALKVSGEGKLSRADNPFLTPIWVNLQKTSLSHCPRLTRFSNPDGLWTTNHKKWLTLTQKGVRPPPTATQGQ